MKTSSREAPLAGGAGGLEHAFSLVALPYGTAAAMAAAPYARGGPGRPWSAGTLSLHPRLAGALVGRGWAEAVGGLLRLTPEGEQRLLLSELRATDDLCLEVVREEGAALLMGFWSGGSMEVGRFADARSASAAAAAIGAGVERVARRGRNC